MAKPYREGKTWSFRFRPCGEDIYRPGYATSAAAKKAFEEMVAERKGKPRPAHMGPEKTSLAVALSDYGQERFPFMKGAAQEARRVNKFLRHLGLPTLVVTKATERGEVKSAMRPEAEDKRLRYHDVQLKATPPAIPQSLVSHRAALKDESVASDAKRRLLARTPMAEVTTYQVQRFVDALKDDGFGAASIHLEIAVIRQVFKHARQVWSWSRPAANPCTGLNLPSAALRTAPQLSQSVVFRHFGCKAS